MNMRKLFFWLHLVAGVVAGVVILIMSVTGAAGVPTSSTRRSFPVPPD